jgi:arginine/lysine/ornithine decarboxylase
MLFASNQVSGQETVPLLDKLQACADKPHAPFYTPGHKRGQGIPQSLANLLGSAVFRADLPELPELDNLFAPEGVIQAAQELAAEAFGAEQTWFLVNGSTCGIIAAILATCATGDPIVLPRNIHQSAIAGLILSGAVPIFVNPEHDPALDLVHSITPAAVATALEQHPEAKAVMMVYPTYEGICGDIAAIAQIAHQHHIPLLVDEAHGPHFAFHPELPTSALAAGADLSVQSTHKVLAAMTQAAMLHVQGDTIEADRVSQALQLVQSTSPSYLLLASLDAARQQMALQGKELMTQTLRLADAARLRISRIPGLSVLGPVPAGLTPGFFALDRTRLTVNVSGLGLNGFTADEILHQRLGVTAELPSLQHLTFIISLGNTEADIEHLVQACVTLAQDYCYPQVQRSLPPFPLPTGDLSIPRRSPREAFFAPAETVTLEQAVDRISTELVCPYPPGIPVLLPGEAIAPAALDYLQQVLALGGSITGCSDLTLQTFKVVRE